MSHNTKKRPTQNAPSTTLGKQSMEDAEDIMIFTSAILKTLRSASKQTKPYKTK